MNKNFASFIKFGIRVHMENFLNGEVYSKSIDYFTKIESKDLRGDNYEGSAYLKQI